MNILIFDRTSLAIASISDQMLFLEEGKSRLECLRGSLTTTSRRLVKLSKEGEKGEINVIPNTVLFACTFKKTKSWLLSNEG
jgi:hypothetical protein